MGATWMPQPGKALVLRTCERRPDGVLVGHDGFPWSSEPGAVVEAPDWNPEPVCGHGLHGLLWGMGDPSYLNRKVPAFMVVEIDGSDAVWVADDKVKFPRCVVVHVGDFRSCAQLLTEHAPATASLRDDVQEVSRFPHRTYVVDLERERPECPAGCDRRDAYVECTHVEPEERIELPVGPMTNLVSSELTGEASLYAQDPFAAMTGEPPDRPVEQMHTVAIDIDNAAVRVVESSTSGHCHLYIDVPMPWRKYRRLLKAMRDAGIIEPGYYSASVARRATFLRLPWVRKPCAAVVLDPFGGA